MNFNIKRFREIMNSALTPQLRAHICAWALEALRNELKEAGDDRTWMLVTMMRDEVTKELLEASNRMTNEPEILRASIILDPESEIITEADALDAHESDGPVPFGWSIIEPSLED